MRFKSNKFRPELILSEINRVRLVLPDRVSWTDLPLIWNEVLAEALEPEYGLSEVDFKIVVSKALNDVRLKKDFDQKQLGGAIARCANEFKNSSKKRLLFFFTVTSGFEKVPKNVVDGDIYITFNPSRNTPFYLRAIAERKKFFDRMTSIRGEWAFLPDPELGVPVLVSVKGNHVQSAYSRASDALAKHRGIANLLLNSGKIARFKSFGSLNQVLERPFTTCHTRNGKLEKELFWAPLHWNGEPAALSDKDIDYLKKQYSVTRSFLQKNPLKKEVGEFIASYCIAYDLPDFKDTFLRSWNLLENILGANEEYDRLIRRLKFHYSDSDHAEQIALYLKQIRNDVVHSSAINAEMAETPMMVMKDFLLHVLKSMIRNQYGFQSLSDFYRLFDTPLVELERNKKVSSLEAELRFLALANEIRSP